MIILTNASEVLEGEPVAINEELIVSVFSSKVKRETSDEEVEITFVFVPPHGTWEVKETVQEVVDLINGV